MPSGAASAATPAGEVVVEHLLLERHTFVTRFGGNDPEHPAVRELYELVRDDPSRVDLDWLEGIVEWLFDTGTVPTGKPEERSVDARTRLLLDTTREIEPFAQRLRAAVVRVFTTSSATHLFTDTGIPTHFGFWRELTDRFVKRVLPAPPVGRELSRLLGRLFQSSERVEWFVGMASDAQTELLHVLGLDPELIRRTLEPGQREAMLLLSTRVATYGTSDDLRKRMPSIAVGTSPFLALPPLVRGVLAGDVPLPKLLNHIDACRLCLHEVAPTLDSTGISIDLVYRLELLHALLTRLSHLSQLHDGAEDRRAIAGVQLTKSLLGGTVDDRSLSSLWNSSTRLLARRVVERAGTSGEQYVTKTRSEQRSMLEAAAGGGAITAFMVFTKFFISHLHPPPFFNALLIGLNYAWGFVLMQVLHFALATKQPSMTAATLAGAIEAQRDEAEPQLEPLVDLVARASRTQLAALVGNVFIVVPFALAVGLGFAALTGAPVLDATYAQKIVTAHHPIESPTIFSAVMTGVWLWLASLLAGAVENAFVLRELPGAIASNRKLRRWLGPQRTSRVSRVLTEQISGLGGNIGFGMLLGFMPMLFVLVGLPLDVRHVTFVSGQLVYAAVTLGPEVFTHRDFLLALLSVPMVGAINFAVSFAFAIVVALRARGLGVRDQVTLLRAVARRFVKNPWPFLVAPPDENR